MKRIINLISSHKVFLAILVILASIFLLTLGQTKLWDWDECLYAGYARSMRMSYNALTNYWNGQVMLDKIPFYTVILQTPLFFSSSEFALRIVNVVFTLFLLFYVYFFTTIRFSKRIGIFAILILLTGDVLVRYFTKISTDIPYALFIILGYLVYTSSITLRKRGLLAGFALGLAALVEGLGVFPFLISLLIMILIFEKKSKFRLSTWLIFGFTITIVPWLLVEYMVYGEKFINVYFIENIIQRSRYPIEFHFGGRLFYLKHIFKELFPWVLLIFVWPLFFLKKLKNITLDNLISEIRSQQRIIEIVLLIFIPLVFLTMAKTKIEWYVAPIYPFLAIYLACCLHLLIRTLKLKNIIVLVIAILIAADGFYFVIKENKLFETVKTSSRDEIAIISSREPEKNLDYLVQFSERRAREILNPTLYTSFTWIYGGNPCAHYYSKKHINYYYRTNDFQKRLGKGNGLFLIHNGDRHYLKDYNVDIVSENSDFTLFRL